MARGRGRNFGMVVSRLAPLDGWPRKRRRSCALISRGHGVEIAYIRGTDSARPASQAGFIFPGRSRNKQGLGGCRKVDSLASLRFI